jgi:xanthine dehydrogenase YagS FAD-binding subunit
MKSFQYATALSVSSAQELATDEGRYLAGGIDLLGELKENLVAPRILVNIKSIPGLDRIESDGKTWSIGANVTLTQLLAHNELGQALPGLREAASDVGSLQIRNVATVGGNLAQHSRCWYYRHRDVQCLKKGGDTCFARNGENKYHSLFSGNPCVSPIASNLAVMLAGLDAKVIVQRGQDRINLTLADLYAKAWDNPIAHNSLGPTDLILRIEVPTRWQRSAYQQVSEKSAFDWALVSCAAAAELAQDKIQQARVVLGVVAPVPYQVAAANDLMKGKVLDESLAGQVADVLLRAAKPLADNGYKVPLARALIQRTLLKLKA